jgi:hypothetical protein
MAARGSPLALAGLLIISRGRGPGTAESLQLRIPILSRSTAERPSAILGS